MVPAGWRVPIPSVQAPAVLALAVLFLAALAGCAAPDAQEASVRLECEANGYTYVITDPWSCLREGGRVVEVTPAAGDWTTVAVKVGWQGREEITAGRLHYDRSRRQGQLLLDLPAAGDVCEGPYELATPSEGTWSAHCESGHTLDVTLLLRQYRVAISALGKDGEGRSFGFTPRPGEG